MNALTIEQLEVFVIGSLNDQGLTWRNTEQALAWHGTTIRTVEALGEAITSYEASDQDSAVQLHNIEAKAVEVLASIIVQLAIHKGTTLNLSKSAGYYLSGNYTDSREDVLEWLGDSIARNGGNTVDLLRDLAGCLIRDVSLYGLTLEGCLRAVLKERKRNRLQLLIYHMRARR
ncbi:hypothetical protein [cf. Phormidesmis sp. LEGE 11477]|uniref:hypothetical protein n=1 Tax=cf. Phormidesmis sp. LEGE 11477 TaxID=1828680 RepID=UPI0018821CDA|nr:hypothetical protein [cf. Phormidesmis sp. LEGE 11477]MBE9064729.1 hypothetical protein [cf. Phormidesmis sp. LEGE 11477]